MKLVHMTYDQYLAEARLRFGPHPVHWRFVCPACGHVASGQDFKDAGCSDADVMRRECIGRHVGGRRAFGDGPGPGPCDYAGYGLFQMSPLRVRLESGREVHSFAFADPGDEARAVATSLNADELAYLADLIARSDRNDAPTAFLIGKTAPLADRLISTKCATFDERDSVLEVTPFGREVNIARRDAATRTPEEP